MSSHLSPSSEDYFEPQMFATPKKKGTKSPTSSPIAPFLNTPSKKTKTPSKSPLSTPVASSLTTPKKSPVSRPSTPKKNPSLHVPSIQEIETTLSDAPFNLETYLASLPEGVSEPILLPVEKKPRSPDEYAGSYRFYEEPPNFTIGDIKDDKMDYMDVGIKIVNPETGAPYEKNGKFVTGFRVEMPPMIVNGLYKNKKVDKYDKYHLIFSPIEGNEDHMLALAFWDKFYEKCKDRFFPLSNSFKHKFQIKKKTTENFNAFVWRQEERDEDGELLPPDTSKPGSMWPAIAIFEPTKTGYDGTTKVYDMTLPMVKRGGVSMYQEVPWYVLKELKVVAVPTFKVYKFRIANKRLACTVTVDNVFIVQHLGRHNQGGDSNETRRMDEMTQRYGHYLSKPNIRQPKYDTKSNGPLPDNAAEEFARSFNS